MSEDNGVFAGHSLLYYKTIIEWPLLLLLLAELFWRVTGGHVIFGWLGSDHYISVPWIFRISFFIYLGWITAIKCKEGWPQAVFAGIISGVIIGIVIGFFQLIWYYNLNAWLGLIALPWRTFLVGALVSGLTAAFLKNFKKEQAHFKQHQKDNKNN